MSGLLTPALGCEIEHALALDNTMSGYPPIETVSRPTCCICGSAGSLLYRNLRDRLFGVEGEWALQRCLNAECGLLWLDPMPAETQLWKLYLNYYTHEDTEPEPLPLSAKVTQRLRRAYCAHRYGYAAKQDWSTFVLRHLAHVLPGHRAQWDFSVFYLPAQPQGRLLEIGCGSGTMLKNMAELGWSVEGVDFDQRAVEVARSRGLVVHSGTLEEQSFPEASFDAVVMSHVIEHVPDPRALLESCKRILKPGGRLVSITPNASSWGHKLYGRDWYNLDPPRHLHLFTLKAMQKLVKEVSIGATDISSVAADAHWVLWSSRQLKRIGYVPSGTEMSVIDKIWSRSLQAAEHLSSSRAGEELLVTAIRD